MLKIPIELVELIVSNLPTKDVLSLTRASTQYNISRRFWETRSSYTKETDQSTLILQKICNAIDLYGKSHKVLFSIRDVAILPFLYKCSGTIICKYDNEVLLSHFISENSLYVTPLKWADHIANHKSVRCFRMLRQYIRTNIMKEPFFNSTENSNDLADGMLVRRCLSEIIVKHPSSVYDFLERAWDDLEHTSDNLAIIFSFSNWKSQDNYFNTMSALLSYPSLLNCNPWYQVLILIACATNDMSWEKLLSVHRNITTPKETIVLQGEESWIRVVYMRTDIPVLQRNYNAMLSTVSWEEWDNVGRPKYITWRYCGGKILTIVERLKGVIDELHIQRLLE